ncbi:MAG: helix-turn-helix domain-containing protein [Rhodocyclales bacterium]|nr:helix-turn-helix domain-containing protein [Rhodocyclales bacterium]
MMAIDEKQAFAERLKLALTRSPKPIDTSAELAVQFNLRHAGTPVTQQAVHKWLNGKASPTPDKIATLAAWLGVSTHWLRFGLPDGGVEVQRLSTAEPAARRYAGGAAVRADEQHLLDSMRRLSPHQQRLIIELVDQLLLERQGQ